MNLPEENPYLPSQVLSVKQPKVSQAGTVFYWMRAILVLQILLQMAYLGTCFAWPIGLLSLLPAGLLLVFSLLQKTFRVLVFAVVSAAWSGGVIAIMCFLPVNPISLPLAFWVVAAFVAIVGQLYLIAAAFDELRDCVLQAQKQASKQRRELRRPR